MSAVNKLLRRGLPPLHEEPWQQTRVHKTLWPPQPGTVRWRERFGAELVCVRYRQSADRRHRFTTLEIVVDHGPVQARASARQPTGRFHVGRMSMRWRDALLAVGAEWDARSGAWRLSRDMARQVGVLGHRAYRDGQIARGLRRV